MNLTKVKKREGKKTKMVKKNVNGKKIAGSSLTKRELIKILKEENPPIKNGQKYRQIILILELKKVKKDLGIIKGEYYYGRFLEYRGSVLIPLGKPDPDKKIVFDDIKKGKSILYGVTIDTRKEKIPEQIFKFFKRSFQDASIQDFIPGLRGKNTE